jgi:hypothetical protein
MFEMFRNSMRIMMNKLKNADKKKQIEDVIAKWSGVNETGFRSHIREIMRICREMGDPVIHFTMMQPAVLDAFISEHAFKRESMAFMRCISEENRIEYRAGSCMRTTVNPADAECTIILPSKNLVNGMDNRTFYYGKLADELLRYTRIRRFVLSGSSALTTLTPIQYDLNPDEIMLFQSQLEAYFDGLEPGTGNVARYNTFYTANPALNPGEIPSNQFTNEAGGTCAAATLKPLTGRASAHYFPASMRLMTFENVEGECTFEAFLSLLREQGDEYADTSVNELKRILALKYTALMKAHKVQMMNYYKHLTANRTILAANAEAFVMNTFHPMTHLDLWILAQHFRLPIVLFSAQVQHPLVENHGNALVLWHDGRVPRDASDVQAYFMMTLGRLRDVAQVYSIVRTGANDMKFSLSQCTNSEFIREIMQQIVFIAANPDADPVTSFISNYAPRRVALKAAVANE